VSRAQLDSNLKMEHDEETNSTGSSSRSARGVRRIGAAFKRPFHKIGQVFSPKNHHRRNGEPQKQTQADVPTPADNMVPGILVVIDRAFNLPSADSNGLSDPYVVLKFGRAEKYRTRVQKKTLNPLWNEECFFPAQIHTAIPLEIEVWDKDLISNDLLGRTELDVSRILSMTQPDTFDLQLKKGNPEMNQGMIRLRVRRERRPAQEVKKKDLRRAKWLNPSPSRTVAVEIVRGRELLPMDKSGTSDPYVNVTLGKMKRSTKVVSRSLQPYWRQRFEFDLGDNDLDKTIRFDVFDRDLLSKDDPMGSATVDLSRLQPNIVHGSWLKLMRCGEKAGYIHTRISIMTYQQDCVLTETQRQASIGLLRLHILRGKNLRARDLGLTSDPYVEVSVGISKLRTQIERKTLNPIWDRMMEIKVEDVFDHVDLTVWDHDVYTNPDFLGRIRVPLLDVQNDGMAKWYPLKTSDLLKRDRGEILVAFHLEYDVVAACARIVTASPRSDMERPPGFSIRRFHNVIRRLLPLILTLIRFFLLGRALFTWQFGIGPTLLAICGWTATCMIFRPFMVPLFILCVIIYNSLKGTKEQEISIDEDGFLHTSYDDKYADEVVQRTIDELGFRETADDEEALVQNENAADFDEKEESSNELSFTAFAKAAKSTVESRANAMLRDKDFILNKPMMEQIRLLFRLGKSVLDVLDFIATFSERGQHLLEWKVPLITKTMSLVLIIQTSLLLFLEWQHAIMLMGYFRFAEEFYFRYVRADPFYSLPWSRLVEAFSRIPSRIDVIRNQRLEPEDRAECCSHRLRSMLTHEAFSFQRGKPNRTAYSEQDQEDEDDDDKEDDQEATRPPKFDKSTKIA